MQHHPIIAGLATLGIAHAAAAQPVLVEHFNGDVLDTTLWSTIENGIGVHIDQANDRLEFSSNGAPGQAGVYGTDWAIATDGDIRLTLDYHLAIANPGQAAVGLNLALYSGGDPGEGTLEDRLEIGIFRQGVDHTLQWFLFDDGALIDGASVAGPTTSGTLHVFYDESTDRLWLSAMGFGNQPDAVVIEDLVTRTAAPRLHVYLGGFMNGASNPVSGDDAWADRLRVTEGALLDLAPPDVLRLDARDDATWFRRGDAAGDRLGWAVRFAGDLDGDGRDETIVGTPRDDGAAPNAGAAAVSSGDDGALVLAVTGEAAGDQLGFAVDGAGDWNDDGVDDVLVGAPRFDTAEHVNAGKVYVYSGAAPHDLLWSEVGEATGDNFGFAVAGIGDVNNDGFDDVLVGAPFSDAGGSNAGRAYVYLGGSGALWSRKTGQAADDQLGRTVAPAGDVDDDGDPDYLVAAPFNDEGGNGAGRVDVYAGDTNARLHAFIGRAAGDRLGWSATGAGDVDGDNFGDVLVGATHDDTAGSNAGAALVFSGADGSVLLELLGEAGGDGFGFAVAAVRDIDGDGVPELAVGAPRHDPGPNNTGRVSIFSGVDGAPLVTIDGESAGSRLGESLDGDASAAPTVSVLTSAWRYTSGGLNKRGSAYRVDLAPSE